ncbi:MAG: ribbon-helix-helix protein, CopG family [Bacteroidetes bacterium]|nr:ribbon-helix-helix protein, CopG family [Bacteroidota bacterium]
MAEKKYIRFSMRVTPEQKRKIERLARRKGTSQKEAVLALIEEALDGEEEPIVPRPGSFLDKYRNIIGSCEGPSDLSTNPKYMEGYGQ